MTHINAFEMDVDEKKQALASAQSELSQAEEALKAHPDYKEPKKEVPKKAKSQSSARSAESGRFVSKGNAKKNPKTTVVESKKSK